MALRVAELETLFTANTEQIAKADKQIKDTKSRVEKNPVKVDADARGAIASMDRVEAQAKRIVSQRTMATVDANIDRAEKSFIRIKERLDYLQSVSPELEVTADIARAEAGMQKALRQLEALRGAKAEMVVDLDTAPVEQGFRRARDAAGTAGDDAGEEFGDGLIAALLSIPIAGAVVGVGAVAAKALVAAFNDGLQVEVRQDRLAALTGLGPEDATRIGRAAAEAYANVFGESIEANMDTARLAVQFDIIDEDATTRDAQKVIENLAGIADVLGEDVGRTAQAVTTLIKTGLAGSSQEAFDIIAAGAREGVNRGEDLLDTFIEYPSVLKRLGLSAEEMLGLLNQSLDAGARNSDVAADALKEFQIRATDASDQSAAGFRRLGLDAEDMTAKIAAGGDSAREGLEIVLDRLRATEDPVLRNAAAVELFGTKAEDLGEALFAMDLSSAVEQLDGVTGSAQRMFDTLTGNDASRIAQAQRNIEVAADGIKGALAAAFAEPVGDFAEFVSENRGPVLQFFADLVNGAVDFAIAANEGFGDFVSGPLAETIDGLASLIDFMNGFEGRPKELDDLANSMRGFKGTTDLAVDGLERMRDEFNVFADGQIEMGLLNDASQRLVRSIAAVGDESGNVEEQVRKAAEALYEEQRAAYAAGESQDELATRYETARQALYDQMVQSGLSEEAARSLIDTVLETPEEMRTRFFVDTATAEAGITSFIDRYDGRRMTVYVDSQTGRNFELNLPGGLRANHDGNVLVPMAYGGLTPMQPIAQMVPPRTWRVVGDRMDVSEAYIPLDGSARSMAILLEAMKRMGVQMMGDGGVTRAATSAPARAGINPTFVMPPGVNEAELVRAAMFELDQYLRGPHA